MSIVLTRVHRPAGRRSRQTRNGPAAEGPLLHSTLCACGWVAPWQGTPQAAKAAMCAHVRGAAR